MENRKRKPLRRRLAIFTSLLAAVLIGATGVAWAAIADNMFPTGNTDSDCSNMTPKTAGFPCRTDNASVYYYMDSADAYELERPDRDAVVATMNHDYRPTDLTVTYDTDIVYQEGRADGAPIHFLGITWCNDAVNGYSARCDQQYVRIRGNGTYIRGLACHETGHAVGLQYGSESSPKVANSDSRLGCLRTPTPDYQSLGSHNKSMINATY